ncbi:MAG: FAD-dependent oxidoreductase [Clostridium sp.]|nr:FAD-dependent oxidoreductase [Clostridium sp.]
MKKTLSFMVVAILALSMFAGCGSKDSPETGAEGLYTAGTYTGEADGHNGKVKVEVEVDAEKILSVKVLENEETEGIADPAIENIPAKIVADQTLAVDTVAGATVTSEAILLAVEEALKEAGADIDALKAKKSDDKDGEKITKDVDLVVVGAGIAGLAATLEAINNGANVILLEKMPAAGGSTIRSGGKILGANTKWQKEKGIEDTAEQFSEYLMEVGENKVDKDFIDLIANKSAENLNWLEENGVEFEPDVEALHSSIKPDRGHWTANDSGAGFTQPLEAKIKEEGGEILYETPATSLIEKDGKVVGVMAENADGDEITINAKAVILATGGFTRNEDMVKEYFPSAGNITTNVGDGNTGDGILMGKEVGAELIMNDAGINLALNNPTYYGYGEEAKGLFVDPSGERFMDESKFHFTRTRIMMDLDIDNCWYVFDENTFNDRVAGALEAGTAVEADSIEELAEKMEADPVKLKSTLDKYNEMSKAGEDTDFGKSADFMNAVEEGKFYAAHMTMSNSGTHGGLKIDIDGKVIDTKGDVIPGLYAAGEVASGQILYKEYTGSGTAIISILTFGRQAGKSAAEEIK